MEGEKKMRKQWRKRAAAFCLAAAVAVSCLPASVPVLAAESEGSPDRLEVLGGEETGTAASAEVQNGAFSGGFEQRPDTANLTKQGTLDWVRLDSKEFGSFNRKNTTEPAVTDLSLIGTSGDLTGNAETNFIYTDGMSPAESPEVCKDSLIFTGSGNGIRFNLPGGSETKCLDIYMGAWAAKAEVTAEVNGETVYTASFEGTDTTPGSQAEYQTLRLDYSTESETDIVTVTVLVGEVYDSTWGNINIGALTLGTERMEDDGSVIGGSAVTAPGSADLTAEGNLRAAFGQLRAAAGDTEEAGDSGDNGNTENGGNDQGKNHNGEIGGSADGNNADSSGKGSVSAKENTAESSSAQKSVKTGDTAAPITGAAAGMMLAAAAGAAAYRRRRERR